jgi:AI-2 transport protein TqsA
MVSNGRQNNALSYLLGVAAFMIIVAGLRVAQSLVVPFLISGFLAVMCAPPLRWLQKKRVPTFLALLLVIAGAMTVFIFVVAIAGAAIDDFARNIKGPEGYQSKLAERQRELLGWLATHKVHIPENVSDVHFNPQRLMPFFTGMLTSLGGVLSNAFLVILTLIFILLEAAEFPKKLLALSRGDASGLERMNKIGESIHRYISMKTGLSLVTGVLIGLWLKFLGVDYPLLWGLLAFLFNFVPNIGSIIAAVPAVMLATIHPGPTEAVYAAFGYLVVNVIVGNVIEPRVMGRGLGLSTLVVFVSLVFWGWVLGPIGMVLSVPLTMIVKIYLDASDETRWLAILLSADVEPKPE